MKNFVYLVGPAHRPEVAVIDPAWEVEQIALALNADNKRLSAIVVTHHHSDHLNGVSQLLGRYPAHVYVQRTEFEFARASFAEFENSLVCLDDGQSIDVGGLPLECIHTPGHTPGAQCIHCQGALFTGDTLFVNACGRCDLPGGSAHELYESLHHRMRRFADDAVVYPGHDYGDIQVSTLERERQQNPYFRCTSESEFVSLRSRPRG